MTSHCIGHDELRPIFSNVVVDMLTQATYITATNAAKLSMVKSDPLGVGEKMILLSPKLANLLPSIATEEDIYYSLRVGERFVQVDTNQYTAHCTLSEGTYPDYKSIIPKSNDFSVTVAVQDLLDAVKRALIFANKDSAMIVRITSYNVCYTKLLRACGRLP